MFQSYCYYRLWYYSNVSYIQLQHLCNSGVCSILELLRHLNRLMAAFKSTNHTGSGYSLEVGRKSKLKTAASISEENSSNSRKASWNKRIEIFLLTCIILIVSFLFITPTVLYALPPLSGTQAVSNHTYICDSSSHLIKSVDTSRGPRLRQNQGS